MSLPSEALPSAAAAAAPRRASSRWRRYASPPVFERVAARAWKPLALAALACAIPALGLAFLVVPPDARHGEAHRLLALHVSAAWLSMWLYAALAAWSVGVLVWRGRVAAVMARAVAPTGALWCALALATGALWGRPAWGTWWVWDARLTSQLLLLLLYLGVIGLRAAVDDDARAARLSALLALVGAVNLPVIWFSVHWWNTLHQGATLTPRGASMEASLLAALLLACAAAWLWSAAVILLRARALLAEARAGAAPAAAPLHGGLR